MGHRADAIAQGKKSRADFLKAFSETRNLTAALNQIERSTSWFYKNTHNWKDFQAAYNAMRYGTTTSTGENKEGEHSIKWDGSFADFRSVFLGRHSPWFHVQLCTVMDKMQGGDIALVIWPPEHGKTSLLEDYYTKCIAIDPTQRITVGKAKIDFAAKVVASVRNRFMPGLIEYYKLRERFGPFHPEGGMNAAGQPQTWKRDAFDVFKRRLGDERDFNMQAIGLNADVAGTRCDRLGIDDPQSRKTLAQTDKILETIRDDWFSRPGVTGSTMILMNVVGDGDIGEALIREDTCDHVTVLKAYDEAYLELGPRQILTDRKDDEGHPIFEMGLSPWLWPERYTERNYDRLKRNAGADGWARKYQQDWRPSTNRSFTKEMWEKCTNELRSVKHPPPKHPSGEEAEIAVGLDPGFGRSAVSAAAFEPTIFRALDTVAVRKPKTLTEIVGMVEAQVDHWHRPGTARVRWVVVENKGFQQGIMTDDRMLELQADIGFELVPQQTGFDKHDADFGVSMMARSMLRGECDFPGADDESVERFAGLRREMLDWRPEIKAANRGNVLQQDELMAMWFLWTRWHKLRRVSIRKQVDASKFGFGGVPMLPGRSVVRPQMVDLSNWNFGKPLIGSRR